MLNSGCSPGYAATPGVCQRMPGLAVLVGPGAGILTYLSEGDLAASVLAGSAAAAGALLLFHHIIG